MMEEIKLLGQVVS